jgi:hypothetical protein
MSDEGQPFRLIPAYPYEGALYWMFEETRSGPERQLHHPYYAGLYGSKSTDRAFRSQAAAAICLFEDVTLVGADAFFPNGLQSINVKVAEDGSRNGGVNGKR